MTIELVLIDGKTGKLAAVSSLGELLIRPYDYSTPVFQDMDTIATAYNFFVPRPGQQFVITMILVNTDKDVGANGSEIIIYETSAVDSTTVDKTILQFQMLKNSVLPLTNILLKVSKGKWVNAKHDDDDVFMTIAGYYIPKVD